MEFHVPVELQPSRLDFALAKACARRVTPTVERALQAVTLPGDQKAVLTAAAALWIACDIAPEAPILGRPTGF